MCGDNSAGDIKSVVCSSFFFLSFGETLDKNTPPVSIMLVKSCDIIEGRKIV